MSTEFSMKDFDQLKRVEDAITKSIVPFRNNRTEAALVVMAALRVARQILELYPAPTRETLLPLLVAFLKGETQMPGVSDPTHPLWMPPTH